MLVEQKETEQFSAVLGPSQSPELTAEVSQSFHEGLKCLQSGKPMAAVAALSRSLELAPDFVHAHVFIGIAQALSHNIYPAIDHLEMATRLQPDGFAAHFTLAQLYLKLRIPQKGYEAAELARQTACTVDQRRALTDLLREERARERNGIMRPWFHKPFNFPVLFLVGSGLVAGLIAIVSHMH